MDALSLDDLLSGLEAAQQQKTQIRLSERNVIELVNKLRELGFLGDELLHTANGREYITRDRLRDEVAAAVNAAGGRLPIVDLPAAVGVDLAHCERAAREVADASRGDISQAQGELFATRYFDALASEVQEELQENGVAVIGDLARRFGLSADMISVALTSRRGEKGALEGRLEGGVLYTDAYLTRVKAQLRGALRGALTPVSLPALRKDLGLAALATLSGLLPSLIDELQREGVIDGKMIAGGGSWVPASYARMQQDAIRAFFQQNGLVDYDLATKHGITNPVQFLSAAFPDGMALTSSFVSAAIVHHIEAAMEDAAVGGGWCDAAGVAPPSLTAADVAQLLETSVAAVEKTASAKSKSGKILGDTCFVSAAFIDGLRQALLGDARRAAEQAHASKKATPGSKSSGKETSNTGNAGFSGASKGVAKGISSKGGKAAMTAMTLSDSDDDVDDWDMGRGKGKKGRGGGGGGGGGGGKKGGKSNSQHVSAKNTTANLKQQQSRGACDASKVGSAAKTSLLSLDALTRRIVAMHPDVEDAGVDGELPSALAAEVRPAVVAEFERALADIFTAGAERRRRLREAASRRLESLYQTFQLYVQGTELFKSDDNVHGVLQRHLLRSVGGPCVDALLHFLAADSAEEEEDDGDTPSVTPEDAVQVPLTPVQRAGLTRDAPEEARAALAAAIKATDAGGASAEDFMASFEAASDASGVRLKRLDKKGQTAAMGAHIESLQRRAATAADAPALLSAAVPLLVAQRRGKCVSVPGKALAAALDSLQDVVDEAGMALLRAFHAAVVQQLKAAGRGGEVGGETRATEEARLTEMEMRVRELIGVPSS